MLKKSIFNLYFNLFTAELEILSNIVFDTCACYFHNDSAKCNVKYFDFIEMMYSIYTYLIFLHFYTYITPDKQICVNPYT